MEKKCKTFRASALLVDVIEYAFTEWLVRQGIFAAFKANYKASVLLRGSFRSVLRAHIRRSLRGPKLAPTQLISTAFLFASTPEGYDFWRKYSVAWERFYFKFQPKL